MPLGAIVARGDVMDWPPGSHASTFGGNPVSCRAALATLDLLRKQYLANTVARGEDLRRGLLRLKEQFPAICGEVRGLGLMMAMDLVRASDERSAPDPALRDEVIQAAFHQGLLLLGCGESALRFCPPLCIDARQIDAALAILAHPRGARGLTSRSIRIEARLRLRERRRASTFARNRKRLSVRTNPHMPVF